MDLMAPILFNQQQSLSINLFELDVYVFIYLWRLRVIRKLCKRASVYLRSHSFELLSLAWV